MKKILVLLLVIIFSSCKTLTSSSTITNVSIQGNWTLSSITFGDTSENQKMIFDGFSKNCLQDSQWSFESNDNLVSMLIEKTNCEVKTKKYKYYTKKSKLKSNAYDLMLIPSDDRKSKGFRFRLEQVSSSFMQWQIIEEKDKKESITTINFIKF